jgi:hypothetical protein
MGFIEILKGEKFSWKNIGIFSVGLIGIALTSQYYLYMTLFISFVFLLILLFRGGILKNWNIWKQFFISGLFSIPFLTIGILPYYLIHRGESSIRPLKDVIAYSASITDYILPFTKSIVAGEWVSNNFPRSLWSESTLSQGIPVLFLAVYGIVKNKDTHLAKIIRTMVTLGVIAFILSLGTNLTWMERPVIIQTPGWLKPIISRDSFYVFLPGYLLFRYFPFYNIMRAWMRHGIILMTMACALAGLGAKEIMEKFRKPMRTMVSMGLMILVLVDFLNTPYGTVEIKPREVDMWLAAQPFGGQVQLPLVESYEQSSIYYTLINQKPLIGQMSTYPSNRYFQLEPILRNFPDDASVEVLRKEEIKYIIIDESYFEVNEAFIDTCQELGLEFKGSFDGQAVFIY